MKRLYPRQPIVGVGAVIVKDGKILLAKRKNEPGRGKWSIPGGLVNLGENVEEAVIREAKEETGLDVEKPEHIDIITNLIQDESGRMKYHYVIIDYHVKIKSGKAVASSDVGDLKWVALEEVERFDLSKGLREFFRRNKQRLRNLQS